jgi:hypothetical protein
MKQRFQRLHNEADLDGGDGGGDGGGAAAATITPPVHFNPDGSFSEGWTSGLGDEFSPHAEALKDFKDVKGLAKSYLHFRKTGPAYPGEASTPEEVSRYQALAQVPTEGSPTGYGVTLPEGASDLDREVLDRITAIAQKNHASAPAVRAMVAEYQTIQAEAAQAFADEAAKVQKAAQDDLVAAWRGDFEANKSTVRHLATTLASQAGINPDDPSFANMVSNPAFGKMMLEVSKLTREDGIRTPAGMGDLRSPRQVADSIMDGSDPVWGQKWKDGDHDERLAAYQEVARLLNKVS